MVTHVAANCSSSKVSPTDFVIECRIFVGTESCNDCLYLLQFRFLKTDVLTYTLIYSPNYGLVTYPLLTYASTVRLFNYLLTYLVACLLAQLLIYQLTCLQTDFSDLEMWCLLTEFARYRSRLRNCFAHLCLFTGALTTQFTHASFATYHCTY